MGQPNAFYEPDDAGPRSKIVFAALGEKKALVLGVQVVERPNIIGCLGPVGVH
jgi:hypothetical protein